MTIEENILKRLADKHSRRILQLTMDRHKSAEEISSELGIPPSTAYRKIKELKEARLLVVERSAITKDGKVCDLYRSAIRGVEINLNSQPLSLDITFSEDIGDKLFLIWRTLREAR